jgi:hypothetical protein
LDDTKDGSKLFVALRTLGASLSNSANGKASSDTSALKPYWGKPAVRNFRGGYGNGGIIRSPLSAITLLDFQVRSVFAIMRSTKLTQEFPRVLHAAESEAVLGCPSCQGTASVVPQA